MRDQTIERWLEALASGAPAPGGGAAAALSAAAGAALIEMVCNLTIGRPRYARHEAIMREALAQATGLRGQALGLAADDATAFGAVTAAYKLPKDTGEQARARTERIQRAMLEATRVPLRTAAVAGDVIRLAGRIAEGANVTALADLAAAAVSARAAVEVVRLNVEANLVAIADPAQRKAFADRMTDLSALVGEAERIVADIRTRIQG
jgi:formiminotetrahydrofolate cyclodeaminase